MAVYVGIDVHKKYCQAALMNDNGRILQELRFDNTQQGATRKWGGYIVRMPLL